MILGLSREAFVASHVVLSLVALLSGVAVLRNLFASRTPAGITALFLATTIATSAGGFLFPSTRVGLGHVVGAVSLVVLLPTVLAIYGGHLAGPWRWIYAAGAIAALYLNAVIAVAQTFMKVPVLRPARAQPDGADVPARASSARRLVHLARGRRGETLPSRAPSSEQRAAPGLITRSCPASCRRGSKACRQAALPFPAAAAAS